MRLTKRTIDKASYEGKSYPGKDGTTKYSRYVLWDDEIPGFGLRVTPDGVKSFVLKYRAAGRQRFITLGRYGTSLTLDKARKKARSKLGSVVDGSDPLKERQEKKRKTESAVSVRRFCEIYLERHAKPHKKTWEEDERRIEKHIKPDLGGLRLEDVTRDRVAQLYQRIGSKHPYEANRVLALVSVMFNLAEDWGYLPEGTPNPAKLRKRNRFSEKRRDRPVTSEELPRLLEAIRKEPDIYVRSALLLYLLTGLRKREVLWAKWEDLDKARGTLRLPDTKAGQPRHVALSEAAQEIFRNIPRQVGNPYIFPSPVKPREPRFDVRKRWLRVRREAGCEGLTIHDLRHSVATWVSETGHAVQVIQAALGHQNISTTMRYLHGSGDGPRAALDAVGEKLREFMNGS